MIFGGLDISTKTGLCILGDIENDSPNVLFAKEIPPVYYPKFEYKDLKRAISIAQYLSSRLDDLEQYPDIFLIENYAYGNHYTLATLVEITTLVKNALYEFNIPFLCIAPTALKKFITGSGAAEKHQMKKMCNLKYGFTHESDNVVDAYCLARTLVDIYKGTNVNDLNSERVKFLIKNRYLNMDRNL